MNLHERTAVETKILKELRTFETASSYSTRNRQETQTGNESVTASSSSQTLPALAKHSSLDLFASKHGKFQTKHLKLYVHNNK